jgi:hypothetical protein
VRLCSYVVKNDTGFAPNPFWGFCTLAACTPNHQNLCLEQGDWLLGHSSRVHGNQIIYVMRISEVLGFDKYYRDPRFAEKKTDLGSWQKRCGDNIYYSDAAGRWRQSETAYFHTSPGDINQDTRYPRVFISEHFYYFGENAVDFPHKYISLIQTRQGCSCNHKAETLQSFISWLEKTYLLGINGQPRDRNETPTALIQIGSSKARANSLGPEQRTQK